MRGGGTSSGAASSPTKEVKVYADAEGGAVRSVEVSEGALEQLDELANKAAVSRYREIFEDLKCRGLKLILNLYHFSLPLWVRDPIKVRARAAERNRTTGLTLRRRVSSPPWALVVIGETI